MAGTHSESANSNSSASSSENSGDRLTASTKLNDTSTLSHGMRTQDGSTYTNTDGRSENASASNQSGYQTANSTNRAQGSHTDETWGERASVNNSPVALAMALQQSQGSAIDALWNLNQSQESRDELARQANANFQLPDNLGNLGGGTQTRVQSHGQSHMNSFSAQKNNTQLPQVNTQSGAVGRFTPQIQKPAYSSAEKAAHQLEAGVVRAAQTYFKYEQTGMMSSIDRSFFGGNLSY